MTAPTATTLVTGCSTGIGHATALRFVERGHRVLATMRDPTRGADAVLPGMRERRGGAIVNVSSVMGRLPVPVSGAYAASKAALEAISEALVLEVADFGIRVAVVAPGFMRSEIASSGLPNSALRPDSPYAPLEQHLTDRNASGVAAGEDPAVAAEAIWQSAVGEPPVFRHTPGAGAARLVEARRSTADEQWFSQLRATLELPTLAVPGTNVP